MLDWCMKCNCQGTESKQANSQTVWLKKFTLKKSEGFLCLTIFRLPYKKKRIQSAKDRRKAAAAAVAWITFQMPKCKRIANLNVYTYAFFMLSRLLAVSPKLYIQPFYTVQSL